MAEFLFHKGSPTYLQPENADVMNISQFMAQNLRQAPPPLPPQPKHTFEISEGESVEIEKIVAAEKKDGQLFYKVKWVKYTWEAETSIQHLPHLIDGYWREHFYQNINQAVIDTSSISGGVTNTTEGGEFSRNKSVVVNPADNRDVQKAVVAAVQQQQTQQDPQQGDKITTVSSGDQSAVVNGAVLSAVTTGNVGVEHNDVILEFSMPQNKVDHSYQNRLVTVGPSQVSGDKKLRRSYPLERKYVCTVCQKAFDRNTSLTRHMLVHTREKPFKCQLCDKAFSQNAHLKRHILIHIGQKSYQCNKCGKMFIEKGGLARHEATHSTEKPWVCNQCGKAFVLNEYLQRHLFLHTGQKPYQCNECGRLFADGSSWRAHKLTHNKEKKYKCHICQKMLKCKRNFKKHVQAHSEDKDMKHRCEICEERFPNKKLLREHYRRSKKLHRCKTCRKFLKSRERFLIHAEFHDPASERYDPNCKVPGGELDEEPDDDDEMQSDEGGVRSEDEMHRAEIEHFHRPEMEHHHRPDIEHHHHHDMDIGQSHPGATVVVNVARDGDEEILTKILESGDKNVVVHHQQQSDQNTGSAVSALTALIMKAENSDEQIPSHHQLQNENNEYTPTMSAMPQLPSIANTRSLDDASTPVDLSIQLVSTTENVQQPQFSNVPTGVDMSHITSERHIEQLSSGGLSGSTVPPIGVGGNRVVQMAPPGSNTATSAVNIREHENNRDNMMSSEQPTNQVEGSIIMMNQNNVMPPM